MNIKPRVFLTSNVFSAEEIGQNQQISKPIRIKIQDLWESLQSNSEFKIFNGRFPSDDQIKKDIEQFDPHILGCHLSHPISKDILENSNIVAVATSTAGFNHIERTEEDNIIITHTPGVLFKTVTDFTIALIMANLRNLIDLHNYIWEGNWALDEKWDLDQKLCSVIDNKVVGIVGLGEIGTELMRRLHAWNLKIFYYDINPNKELEKLYPNLEYKEKIAAIFEESDIISLHIPLNSKTKHIVNKKLLKLMKKNALLVNTARGPIIDFDDLLELLENGEININIAFDVYPEEPIDPYILKRLKSIKENNPQIRMILIPHNASADADTRGNMAIIVLEDILKIINSEKIKDLEQVHLIPPHKEKLYKNNWRISQYW